MASETNETEPGETEPTPNQVKKRFNRSPVGHTVDETLSLRRSGVRRYVTYGAAAYLFLGGLVMVCVVAYGSAGEDSIPVNIMAAKDVFMSIVPVASGIVAYWFATRGKPSENGDGDKKQGSNT